MFHLSIVQQRQRIEELDQLGQHVLRQLLSQPLSQLGVVEAVRGGEVAQDLLRRLSGLCRRCEGNMGLSECISP